MGELHTCFASLHAIVKYIENSGLESISIEGGLYSPATIRQIFTGKWFRRGVEYHMTNLMACYDLLFEASTEEEFLETMSGKCQKLGIKLHSRQEDVTSVFEEITEICRDQFNTWCEKDLGEMAQFLLSYMKQVESLLHLIRTSRQEIGSCILVSLRSRSSIILPTICTNMPASLPFTLHKCSLSRRLTRRHGMF